MIRSSGSEEAERLWRRERVRSMDPRIHRVGQHSISINEIMHSKRGITADTALRLAKHFGTSAEFWIKLQSHYELDRAEDAAGEQIDAIAPLQTA